jgi:hypothetical protein
MGGSDKESDLVFVFRSTGLNGLDRRHPEDGDENGEHLEDCHSPKKTGWRTSFVSPVRAM